MNNHMLWKIDHCNSVKLFVTENKTRTSKTNSGRRIFDSQHLLGPISFYLLSKLTQIEAHFLAQKHWMDECGFYCHKNRAVRIYQPPNRCIILWIPTPSSPQQLGSNPSKAWVSTVVFKWSQGALLGGLGCVLCRACVIHWDQHGLLTLKAEPARQRVDNANLSWT